MESTEEESREDYPSLPANYVSLVQLKERWLQRQREKQEIEKRKENQKHKQPQHEGKLIIATPNQRQGKDKNKFCENEHGRKRNEWRRVEGHRKVYVPNRGLAGNRPKIDGAERELKSEVFKIGARTHHGVGGVHGIEEKIVSGKEKDGNWKKNVAGVKGSLIGEEENGGNLGDSSWKTGGEERSRGEFERNGNGVEENVSACMVAIVPENKGKEVALVGMCGKYCGDKGFKEQDWGNIDDQKLGGSVGECMVELLPKSGWVEEVLVAGNGDDHGISDAGSVCMVKVLPENKVEENCSVSVLRKKGKGRSRGKNQRNVGDSRKQTFGKDSKVELGLEEVPVAGNGDDHGISEVGSVCMVKVLPENEVKENCSVSVGRQRDKGSFRGGYQRNVGDSRKQTFGKDSKVELGLEEVPVAGNGDDHGISEVGSVCMVKVLPENEVKENCSVSVGRQRDKGSFRGGYQRNVGDSRKQTFGKDSKVELGLEEVPVAGNGDDHGISEVGSVCMVKVLPENEVKENCSVSVGRQRDEGSFRGGYQRNVGDSRERTVPKDRKVELGYEKDEVEEGVFVGENGRTSDQKRRTGRGIQSYRGKEKISGNLWPKIRRDLRFLSLDESREGNVTSRKGQHGQQGRRYEESRDGGLVWVKKGAISVTNATEI